MTMAVFNLPPDPVPHIPVLRDEILQAFLGEPGERVEVGPPRLFVDATLGFGGHTEALLLASPALRVIGLDRDPLAVASSRARLAPFGDRVDIVHSAFSALDEVLRDRGVSRVDGVLADLGVNSKQIDDGDRGMSFRTDGPLDMRMDPSSGETALDLITRLSQDQLADVIFQYGEERRSRRVARCIKQALESGELATTLDLRRAVVRAVGPRRVGGIDPATRTFQGVRIAVNRELTELGQLLSKLPSVVKPGGTACIISFHSLEDRAVKQAFRQPDLWRRVNSKPIIASDREREENPRARSAKLRVARRLALEAVFGGY